MRRTYGWLLPLAGVAALAGCNQAETSTREIRQAAIDRVRADFDVPAETELEATVWTGREHDGKLVMCGTVSDTSGQGAVVRPQRFALTTNPMQWLVFEDAHDPMIASRPDKFAEWGPLCRQTQAA